MLRVDPKDARECVVAMCPKSKETFSCKELGEGARAKCSPCDGKPCDAQFIYKIQLLVKDSASQLNKNFYRVLLYSHEEGLGNTFFGSEHKPVNLYKDEAELKHIERQLTTM